MPPPVVGKAPIGVDDTKAHPGKFSGRQEAIGTVGAVDDDFLVSGKNFIGPFNF